MIPEFKSFVSESSCQHRWGALYSYSGVTSEGFSEYVTLMEKNGYCPYHKNTVDGNTFYTYVNGENQVNIAYYPNVVINNYYYPVLKPDGHHDYTIPYLKNIYADSVMKVSVNALGYLPELEAPKFEELVEPTVTQMKQIGVGMSYVIQLADGSFIIIDGGIGAEGSLEYHLEFLEAHKPKEHKKPRVAWFFTHAHPDHTVLPVKFMEKYGDRIEVILFAHALIDETGDYAKTLVDVDKNGVNALRDTVRKSGSRELVFHTGQVIRLAGCEVHVLNTYEDTYPTPIGTLNSTSSIFKLVFKNNDGQRSILIVGDSTETNTSFVNAVYTKDTLKSDILQVAHHGVNASVGTQHLREFYANVSPRTALFSNVKKIVEEAAFAPNIELGDAEWIFADGEQTITIFD